MATKVTDKIDPFSTKASIKGRKQKRSQGSSHYRTKGQTELQALPQLKGEYYLTPSFFYGIRTLYRSFTTQGPCPFASENNTFRPYFINEVHTDIRLKSKIPHIAAKWQPCTVILKLFVVLIAVLI